MRIYLGLLLLLAPAAQAQDNLPQPGQPELSTLGEQVSYSLGLDLGRRLKQDGVQVDFGAIVAGLRDGLTDAEPMLTDEQITQVMKQFQQQMQQKAENQMAQAAQQNLARGAEFADQYAKKEGVQKTDSGLLYRVIEEGDGASPGPEDTVRVHYEGTLTTGEVFDSSYRRGEPTEFPVGAVISGWTEALQMMKSGAKWEVVLPPDIAYGARGAGGAIGPNETLVFKIELLDVLD
ncbi:FKBP-type peptidyl-prolyl cis-trans isomerase [Botrimarina sp.]|uniref:FKBP-type peptidyl-prolyl cis-trans isomerase n=1 Tax=Botrimarina sp. TaxID=2795802 RepID=UPI0032EC0579